MALAERPLPVFQRGEWPGPLTLRRGWARADVRRWNDAHSDGSLRLVRGGAGFLEACTERVKGFGAPSVLSPPLPPSATRTWQTAGYSEFIKLALMRLDLDTPIQPPTHLVIETDPDDLERLLAIDIAAFPPFWRFDRNGLDESLHATTRSSVLIIRDSDGEPAAFSVVGFGHAIAYLQRLAVHPDWQCQGMGRSLVRVSARKARAEGARAMLLNTQFDNTPAIALYETEGFQLLPEPLALLRC